MGRVSVVIGAVVLLVLAAGATAYWYVKDRQRISQGAVEKKVAASENATGVVCVEKVAHGRRWHCAGKVGSQGECFSVVVDWRGDATVNPLKANRCSAEPQLAPILSG
jgi:hypothetical protein